MEIKFYEVDSEKIQLTFVVMCAKYKNQWVFVRHRDRLTWEVPGGHIEVGEAPDIAAVRELREEAGVTKSQLFPICDYSVEDSIGINYGRLYFTEIEEFGESLDYEIEEVIFREELPTQLTYQEILPQLFEKVMHSYQKQTNGGTYNDQET